MAADVHGITVAIATTDGYDTAEIEGLRKALDDAGVITRVVGDHAGALQATGGAHQLSVDLTMDEADPNEFDALLVAGGEAAAPRLRNNPLARALALSFHSEGKPMAAVCEGVGLLVSAGAVNGKRVTGARALRTDVRAAGGEWVDEEIVVDGALLTARAAGPLLAERLIALLAEQVNWTPVREGSLRRQHPAREG